MTQPSREFLEFQAALAGEYSIQRELGRGGMGIVYFARDVQLDRDVAIKALPVELSSIAARERFLREARTAASLSNPNIVPIHRLLEAGTGRTLVTHFGIARCRATHTGDTDPGMVMGTAHFMSPEQAAGEPLDGRSDIHALGGVGYLAVSGRLPFEASTLPALMVRKATESPLAVQRPPSRLTRQRMCERDESCVLAQGQEIGIAVDRIQSVQIA